MSSIYGKAFVGAALRYLGAANPAADADAPLLYSDFLQIFGFQHELGPVDLAAHFVAVRDFAETDALDFGALLEDG